MDKIQKSESQDEKGLSLGPKLKLSTVNINDDEKLEGDGLTKGFDMEEFLLMSTDEKLKNIPEALYDLVP